MKVFNVWVFFVVVVIWVVLVFVLNIYDDYYVFIEVEIEGLVEVLLVYGVEVVVSQRYGGLDVSIMIENKILKICVEKGIKFFIIRVIYNKFFNLVVKGGVIVIVREVIFVECLEIVLENKVYVNLNFKVELVNVYV